MTAHWTPRCAGSADASSDRPPGIVEGFLALHGWLPAYPETTGYVLGTLLEYAAQTGEEATWSSGPGAMGDWEMRSAGAGRRDHGGRRRHRPAPIDRVQHGHGAPWLAGPLSEATDRRLRSSRGASHGLPGRPSAARRDLGAEVESRRNPAHLQLARRPGPCCAWARRNGDESARGRRLAGTSTGSCLANAQTAGSTTASSSRA